MILMVKKFLTLFIISSLLICAGCSNTNISTQIAATTLPVYEFTDLLCRGTDISVTQVVTESVSCLHDYTLKVSQMRTLESAKVTVISGAGLEAFLGDALDPSNTIIDASVGVPIITPEDISTHSHEHEHNHKHEHDPHIWLSPDNAIIMARNICNGLTTVFPQHASVFEKNLIALEEELEALKEYGTIKLSNLDCRDLITFHDGFTYFADAFDLHILKSIEEEAGSEAAASEIIEIVELINANRLPAIFTEQNSSASAAGIIHAETGVSIYALDMAMSGESYFNAMYHNIDTIKEALG